MPTVRRKHLVAASCAAGAFILAIVAMFAWPALGPHGAGPLGGRGAFGAAPGDDTTGTATVTPSATAAVTTTTAPATGKPRTFPSTLTAYAIATVNAWSVRNDLELASLTAAKAMADLGRPPSGMDSRWRDYPCGAPTNLPCVELRNRNGDVVRVQIDPALLGKARAVVGAAKDPTVYRSAPFDYVYEVLDAWSADNTERIQSLVASSATWFFGVNPAPSGGRSAFDGFTLYQSSIDPATIICVKFQDKVNYTSFLFGVDMRRYGNAHAVISTGSEVQC